LCPLCQACGSTHRATAIGEAGQHEQNTAAADTADTADDGERAALKRIALENESEQFHCSGIIAAKFFALL
jgi:hypothetical protein